MKNLLIFLLLLSGQLFAGDPISCGPLTGKFKVSAVTITSLRSGDFYDPNTWIGGKVPAVTDNVTIADGHFIFTNNRYINFQGELKGHIGGLQIRGVNENAMTPVSGIVDVIPNNIGIYFTGAGRSNIVGDYKLEMAYSTTGLFKGATSVTLKVMPLGWKFGDEIVIAPMHLPNSAQEENWDDNTNKSIDLFADQFERVIITGISGNIVSFNKPLLYDHKQVLGWTPEVMNLTRSFVIEGTPTGRTFIFRRSTQAQIMKYVEGRWLGPQQGSGRPFLVQGIYADHNHFSYDGSRGSIWEGCSYHDIGSRMYVPHASHGITYKNNIGFNGLAEYFWYDFQSVTNDLRYEGNIMACQRNSGYGAFKGMILGQGDNNRAERNVAIYMAHGSDIKSQGAFQWDADNESKWFFDQNRGHSNGTYVFDWQNTGLMHILSRDTAFNNGFGMIMGAYSHNYKIERSLLYNSPLHLQATQTSTDAMFENTTFDGAGNLDYVVNAVSSPADAGGYGNGFLNCTFKGYRISPFLLGANAEPGRKGVDLINSTITGTKYVTFDPNLVPDSWMRVQPPTGQAIRITKSGTSNIGTFAPKLYGSMPGGLNAKYYVGNNFNTLAFERIDELIKYAQWAYSVTQVPTGVNYTIPTTSPFSIIEEGTVESHFSEPTTFIFNQQGGTRMYFEGNLILDNWLDKNESDILIASSPVNMIAGKRYRIKLEHKDEGGTGPKGWMMYWKSASMPMTMQVPESQLHPLTDTIPPPPPPPGPNLSPVVSAGPDVSIILPDSIVKLTGSIKDDSVGYKGAWKQISGPSQAGFEFQSTLEEIKVVALKEGIYVFELKVTDAGGLTASDQVIVTVNKPIPVSTLQANAGPDQNITGAQATLNGSGSTGTITSYRWYYDGGPNEWNLVDQNAKTTTANRLVKGSYVFKLQIRDAAGKISEDRVTINVGVTPTIFTNTVQSGSVTCPSGKVISYTVPANKYSAANQAAADALAIQELNTELSKCPTVVGTFTVASLGWVITVYSDKTVILK